MMQLLIYWPVGMMRGMTRATFPFISVPTSKDMAMDFESQVE
jgi:hypothetical protein